MINIIVAMDKNGVIGKDNSLPWRIKEDMEYFKKTTMDNVVVMGRNTHESIPKKLEGRWNYTISANPEYNHKWGVRVWSIEQFMGWSKYYKNQFDMDTFVIGGAQIYKQFYPIVDKLYITYVNDIYEGDCYFPIPFHQINEDFEIESRKMGKKCEFIIMRRKSHEI